MRKNKKKVIVALAVIVAFMAVGYALLGTDLVINGNSKITSEWRVVITDVKVQELNGGENMDSTFASAKDDVEFDETSVTFYAGLKNPGAAVNYYVTFENQGNIPAELDINGLEDQLGDLNLVDPTDVTYFKAYTPSTLAEWSQTTAAVENELQPGEKATYMVGVNWSNEATSLPDVLTKEATITFHYDQMEGAAA